MIFPIEHGSFETGELWVGGGGSAAAAAAAAAAADLLTLCIMITATYLTGSWFD